MVVDESKRTEDAPQEGVAAEHHGPAEHKPSLSVWPFPLAVGVAMTLVGLAVSPGLIGAGAVIAAFSLVGWLREAREENRIEGAATVRFVQMVVFQVMPDALPALAQPQGPLAQLAAHAAELRRRQEFRDLLVTRTPNAAGPVLVVVQTGWEAGDDLADYSAGPANVEKLVRSWDVVIPGTIEVYDMEAMG